MLRERYEQMREQALERAGISPPNAGAMRWGMRSWMEAGDQGVTASSRPPGDAHRELDWEFSQISMAV
jgi:hypothetical protein